ncbi:hypothetical protein JRI60_26905 [Archangium violaceum]|uniref:hypothetical protein n=1 Tax=Archangium violaceum TaxID=83451 RepID=UPI00194FBEAF|nr:hypothetical protein [Archangium violaceum]QRN92842.1 hypothetical protein JRI60_26905 [Archangium violaceum]
MQPDEVTPSDMPSERHQDAGAPPEGDAPRARRERKPKTPEQARASNARRAVSRRLERLMAEGNIDQLEAAAAALEDVTPGKRGKGGEPAAPAEKKPAEGQDKAAALPPEDEVRLWAPAAESLAKTLAAGVKGTRFEQSPEIQQELAAALAPVMAKYGPAVMTTPEARLGLVLAAWLAKPTAELVAEKFFGDGGKADGNARALQGAGTPVAAA